MRYKIYKKGGYGVGGFDITGGNVSGPVILSEDPTSPLQAATKNYVDTRVNNLSGTDFKTGTLPIERLPSFTGEASSQEGNNIITLNDTGVSPGIYTKVRIDSKGRITNGYSLIESDLPSIDWSKIFGGKPTTLAGYGITDALTPEGGSVTGFLETNLAPVNALQAANKQYVDTLAAPTAGTLKTGDVVVKSTPTTPSGFLRCNGGELLKTEYPALYSVIGDSFNVELTVGSGKPWRQQYAFNTSQSGDITGWTTGTSLPGALTGSQAIVTKNRVYLLGGNSGTTQVSTVYTAPINADGTIGAWTTGTPLPVRLNVSQAVVTKNRVYLIGGHNGTTTASTVYTAPINADGTLGAWTIGTSLPGPLSHSQAIVTSSKVYLLGGYNGTTVMSSIYVAPFSGGMNEYMSVVDTTYMSTTPDKFRLPDYSYKELYNSYTYIKS